MTSTPGWYRDPGGLPFERFWNGDVWTEHTRPIAPLPPPGYPPAFSSTAPLPNVSPTPNRSWYQRKGVLIPAGVVFALLIVGLVGSMVDPSKKASHSVALSDEPSSPVRSSSHSTVAAPSVTTSSTHSSVARAEHTTSKPTVAAVQTPAADVGSFAMPNEVGQVLQDAQDDIQRVSGDPIFFTHSHDLRGDRFQVLDANWKVCDQNVGPGEHVSAIGHIDFGVVKLEESCP
jgi:hypothetical protein